MGPRIRHLVTRVHAFFREELPLSWAYREKMKTKSVQYELARRLAERDQLNVDILELEGQLARAQRRLHELSTEIASLGHVEH
jgi:hypothetical protein